MGGSGGFFGRSDPDDLAKKIREAEEQSANSEFNSNVNKMINDLLAYVNDRPYSEIETHLNTIEQALMSDIEGYIDLKYGGSVAKHTYVDGLSDIDSLAILNNSELADYNPKDILSFFYERLKQRLPNTDISKGQLAVTLNFTDKIQIQILPALKTGTGIKIASSNGENNWSSVIKPDKFAEKLRDVNRQNQQKVIPVIKLAKSIISSLPEKRQITGYHTESLAIEAFENYSGIKNPKEMLKHFFSESSKRILAPIKDNTGQSIHVDDYLGENNSIQRQIVSDSFSQIVRKMQNADGAQQISQWKSLLE
ncbi:MAG TPA: CBASS oligonucleotide cyclase [Bacteroidales bacterium]